MGNLVDIHIMIDKNLYARVKSLRFHKGDISFFLTEAVREKVERKEKEIKEFDEYKRLKEKGGNKIE